MKKYINHAVIWKKKDKNGKTYLAFKAERDIKEGEWLSLFANDKGDNPKRPDFKAYEEKEEHTSESVSNDVPF